MARAARLTVCTVSGCPTLTNGGRCPEHRTQAERARGTATQRGYGTAHRTRFRADVLAKNPTCVCTITDHGHGEPCGKPSKHADHHPKDRRQLVAEDLDPNDPRHGRGLCGPCHSRHTATEQPGGWNQ